MWLLSDGDDLHVSALERLAAFSMKSSERFSAPKMTITTLISMPNCVGAYRKEKSPPSVFGHVLDAHQLEPQSAYAIEDSVEV